MTINLEDVKRLTAECDDGWLMAHCHHLLSLIDRIGAGLSYDREALEYAVYMHDWGAMPRFKRAGVDHALRSRQVAEEEILPKTALTPAQKEIVLVAIECHDYRSTLPVCSQEGLLLREADFLEFLGANGVVREYAWSPNHLRRAYQQILKRRDAIRGHFTLPVAQEMAAERLGRMEKILGWLEEESFGEM